MKEWSDLEHRLWAELKNARLEEAPLLVGLSGGVDSVALLRALSRVRPRGLTACYVHHGTGAHQTYRDRAQGFCRDLCQSFGVAFFTEKWNGPELKGEEALRDYRYQVLRETQAKTGAKALVLAHHSEDLLETRLLRLLRGTGPQGLVAMEVFSEGLFRPWLKHSKKELQQYLDEAQVVVCQDPSNRELEPLRNWLRQDWLPQLESRHSGAVAAFARSLDRIVEALAETTWPEGLFQERALSRTLYWSLSDSRQKQALAELLRLGKMSFFTHSQLEEVRKRLDNSQKEFIFKIGRLEWHINAEQIRVQESE